MTDRKKQTIQGLIAIAFGALYLLNPTGGFIELIPDVIPIVGNIDEAAATGILIWGINTLRPGTFNFLNNEQAISQAYATHGEEQKPDTPDTDRPERGVK
jgi:uncharacterized membrane protein YkvA (DUF1232 family)